jgi:hypothetical protein
VRAWEESAEIIVVKTFAERQAERRVEEPRESSQPTCLRRKEREALRNLVGLATAAGSHEGGVGAGEWISSEPTTTKGKFSAGRKEVAEDAQ